MTEKRYEIIYYFEGRRGQYHTDDKQDAINQARILKDELKYFPVVIYDTETQDWVEF